MPNNIAVSITADVADLQVKRAILSAELKAAQKDLNDFAKTAATSGSTDALRTSMLAAGDAVAKTRNQIGLVDREMKALTATTAAAAAATEAETVATEASTAAHVSNRAAYEGLVLVHEALSGNYHRMVGSLMIEAQAMAGASRTAAFFNAALSTTGLAIIGVAAAATVGIVAAYQYEKAEKDLADATLGLGAASGVSAEQIKQLSNEALGNLKTSYGENVTALKAFTAAGVGNQDTLRTLVGVTADFAALTGQKAPDALKELAEAMADPKKGAEELNEQLHFLDANQLRAIQSAIDLGDKEKAQAEIAQALAARSREASDAVGGLENPFDRVAKAAAFAAHAMGEALVAMQRFDQLKGAPAAAAGVNAAAQRVQDQARLRQQSAAGLALEDATPEAKAGSERNQLQGKVNTLNTALQADIKLYGDHSDAVKRDREALSEYTRALQTYLSPAEKAHAIAALDAQIAGTKNVALKQQLTTQKEMLQLSGQVMSQQEAQQRAQDAGRIAGSRAGRAAGGESPLTHMETDLRAQEFAIRQSTGDWTKDMGEFEVNFWQQKLATAKQGSKLYGEILTRLQEAQLAEGREGVEKEHERAQVAREAAQERLAELQETQRAEQEIRNRNLQAQEGQIRSSAQRSGNPFAQVAAEQQIAQLQKQAIQQQADELQTAFLQRQTLLDKEVGDALKAYGIESVEYQKAIDKRRAADVQYYNQRRALENQAVQQQIQAQQRIADTWHSRIDPMVHSVGSQIQGLINGTEKWSQALLNIGKSIESSIIQAIEKVVENWIIAQITGQTSQAATAETGILAAAAQAGANGVASMAGAPWPIDMTAPAFGAAMATTAASFSLGGFAKGLDVVPQDMIAQIHQGERIVPKADNAAIMAAVGAGAGSSRGGDTHISLTHAPQISGGAPANVVKQLESNKRDFARLLKSMARDGHFKAA